MPLCNQISVAARDSCLSRAQVREVCQELQTIHPNCVFAPTWIQTTGDCRLDVSLKFLSKTNFFTKEIDQWVLSGICRVGIHSAKDLPDPLEQGLKIVAITRGVDARDVLVLLPHQTIDTLPKKARIATSSLRREKAIKDLREDLICVDIRGVIEARLACLYRGEIEGLVVAEAALVRLGLIHLNRFFLSTEVAALQGKLAVVARQDDQEMLQLFSVINTFQELDLISGYL
ncbi:MAG: hydroxymethylbilane synthase [Chlamydiales bacterium]|jgi:hydroxymethylbilane synthase|nr:hydroxymethylbilane synthase [Chlamydiales bacterium]